MKTVLSAAALSLMACSLAWAVPNTSPNPQLGASTTDLVKIDNRDRDHGKRHWGDQAYDNDRRGDRDHWRGQAYDNDWRRHYSHRYSYRPHDWDDRGCINVGPVWYCS
jgi:hypothetical protein